MLHLFLLHYLLLTYVYDCMCEVIAIKIGCSKLLVYMIHINSNNNQKTLSITRKVIFEYYKASLACYSIVVNNEKQSFNRVCDY